MSCIFCRIVAGEIPATVVYEDDLTLAFLDIAPIIKGHTLVIPKPHVQHITEIPPDLLGACMLTVQRIACTQMTSLNADGVNIHQANGAAAGQVVPHLHFHVVPRFTHDGHHWNWKSTPYASLDAMSAIGATLRLACKDKAGKPC